MVAITLRADLTRGLTNEEIDANFINLKNGVQARLVSSDNLSDLANPSTARINLGLGNVENKSSATIRSELSSSNVTTALGFTPYNTTNPSGYITASASITGNAATATALQTARTINGVSFNGSANITIVDGTKLPLAGGTMTGGLTVGGNLGLSGNSGGVRVIGPIAGTNTTLVLEGSSATGSSANIELTRDNLIFLDATQSRFRSQDASVAFLNISSGATNVLTGALQQQGNQVLHEGNVTTYAVTPTGTQTLTNKTITGGIVNPTTLQEGGVAAVVQTDIGTAPNQIPLNQYLGNLAYQDAANIAGPVGVGGALTLNSGTANGVAFLNGSKVLTTGSALTFDGTKIQIGKDVSGAVTNSISLGNSGIGGGIVTSTLFLARYGDNYGAYIQAIANYSATTTPNLIFGISAAERMRITSGGDVVVNGGNLTMAGAAPLLAATASGSALRFGTGAGGTERMRIDSSGNLLVGRTDLITFSSNSNNGVVLRPDRIDVSAASVARITQIRDSTGTLDRFYNGADVVGSITCTTTATAYNTSSDYRLKNTIAPMTGALAKVALLKPCTYKWNADGSDGEGFIAHELQAVVPQCVTGEKDAVDAEGKPQHQGIDTSFLVATLTAAIQELKAEFDAYKASHP